MANLILTPEWVEGIYQLETSDPVMGGPDGIDNRQAIQLGKRTEFLKQELEKRATTESPILTGTPKAPTPAQSVNNEQIATTAFVKAAIAALVGSAPTTLDTLAEIATALGNDGNLKQVLLDEIGKKANLTDFTTLKNILVGIPFPYPLSAVPNGCLAFNGQAFSTSTYPELAKKYPSGRLPDLRGEFIRGWDNGRGVDSSRNLLSYQAGTKIVGEGGNPDSANRHTIYDINNIFGDPVYESSRDFNAKLEYSLTKSIIEESIFYWRTTRPRNIAFQYICLVA